MDDAELLRTYARTADEAAFAELVRRHAPLVYSAALRRMDGDAHAAQDVAQRVFLRLARHAAALARHPALVGWLHETTRHAASEQRRAATRRRRREELYMTDPALGSTRDAASAGPAPAGDEVWRDISPLLDAALDALGDTERQVLLLRYFTGASFAEIGARLGLSDAAAQMRAARALEKLRRLLARRGVTSTASALGLALGSHAVSAAPAGFTAATIAAVASAPAAGAVSTVGFALLSMNHSAKILLVATCLAAGAGAYLYLSADDSGQPSPAPAPVSPTNASTDNTDESQTLPASAAAAMAKQPTAAKGTVASSAQGDRNPASPPVTAAQVRVQMAKFYERFLRHSGLTAVQREQFLDAATKRHLALLDASNSGRQRGIDVDDPKALNAWREEVSGPGANDLRALLGREGFEKLGVYERAEGLRSYYGQLIEEWGLSPEKSDALVDALSRRHEDTRNAVEDGRRHGINVDDPRELADWRNELAGRGAALIRAQIGDEAFSRMLEYERQTDARRHVTAIALRAESAGAPMSAQQRRKLIELVHSLPAPKAPESPAGLGPWRDYRRSLATRYRAIENLGAEFLSPAQIQVISEVAKLNVEDVDRRLAKFPRSK